MALGAVRQKVDQLAKEIGTEEATVYHFIYGVIKLTQMNPFMRDKVLFKGAEEHEEIEKLVEFVNSNGLNDAAVLEKIKVLAQGKAQEIVEIERYKTFLRDNADSTLSSALTLLLAADTNLLSELQGKGNGPEDENKRVFHNLIGTTRILTQKLKERLGGQDEAIRRFVEGYFQSEILRDEDAKQPRAAFLFAGPAGVGKSTVAEEAAKILNLPFLKIELSEYAAESSAFDLVASIQGMDDCPPGKISTFVDKNPRGIILFNEVDTCNPKVIGALSKILEFGTVYDHMLKKDISFKDAILVFTSTLGSSLYGRDKEKNVSILPSAVIFDAIIKEFSHNPAGEYFRAFLSENFACDNIIMFNYTSVRHLTNIVKQGFSDFTAKMQKAYGFNISVSSEVTNVFFYNEYYALDAHNAKLKSGIFLKNEMYEFGRHVNLESNTFEKIKDVRFKVEVPAVGEPLRSLFYNEGVAKVLVIADEKDVQIPADCQHLELVYAHDYAETLEIIRENDINFCILDLYYKQNQATLHYLSLDDVRSVGVDCFDKISKDLSDLPVYILEKSGMDEEDKATFLQRGARQFISIRDEAEAHKVLTDISQRLYMQSQVNRLERKGKILAFNTSQEISADGKTVSIAFYDFYTRNIPLDENERLSLVEDMQPKARFVDVVGAKNAKKELAYLSEYLTNPRGFILKEGKAPNGVLLFGLPEAGKTSLAKALAGESGAAFIHVAASFLSSAFKVNPDGGIEKLISYFECAKRCAPAVIFIDKLELLGVIRNELQDHYKDILLEEIEALQKDIKHPVLFIASVDWDESHISSENAGLDATLMHRMDYKIYVNLPDKDERMAFLREQVGKNPYSTVTEAALRNIAERTPGMSVAMLKDYLAIAFRDAKRATTKLDDKLFLEALDEYEFGEKHDWNEDEYKSTAIHEAGHAYLTWKNGRKSSFVTIVSRGSFGGYTMPEINEKGEGSHTQKQLLEEIRVDLAGRASEIVFFGKEAGTNSGISGDLQMATNCALTMICYYGMDDKSLVSLPPEIILKSSLSGEIIHRVSELLQKELENTIKIVEEGKEAIHALADELLARNQLTGPEIEDVFNKFSKK